MKLKDVNMIIKCLLIIYVAVMIVVDSRNSIISVALILLFFTLNFIVEMVQVEIKKIIYIVMIALSLLLSFRYISEAAILLSVTSMDFILNIYNKSILAIIVSAIPIIFLNDERLISGIIIILLTYVAFFMVNKIDEKLKRLEVSNENQRKRIYSLENKLKEERKFNEQAYYNIKLEERNKISGNLHDKIGHTISGTILQLEAAKVIMSKDKNKGIEMMNISISNLRNGMDEIRKTLREINPAQEEIGINRIKLLLEEKTKNTQYRYRISYKGELNKISPSVWRVLIEASRELSTNTIKYADGDLIQVKIDILNTIIKFEVRDNGKGSEIVKKSLGLFNLEIRISEMNGKVIIDGSNGFSVILLIPIK